MENGERRPPQSQVGKTTTTELIERLREVGIERQQLPPNVNEFFGTFASERANVIKAVNFVRHSPIIGPRIPVHGLVVDTETGRVDWLVNGYQALELMGAHPELAAPVGHPADALTSLGDFKIGELKFPDAKIGDTVAKTEDWLSGNIQPLAPKPPPEIPPAKPATPPRIPLPPPLRPKFRLYKGPK